METVSLTVAVRGEMLAHPEVTEAPHRFGGIVFHVGGREIGHLHGETVADLPLPRHIREGLAAPGRASFDHDVSEVVWVSREVSGPQDVQDVVALFRMSYEHAASEAALAAVNHARDGPPPLDLPGREGAAWREVLRSPLRTIVRRRRRR